MLAEVGALLHEVKLFLRQWPKHLLNDAQLPSPIIEWRWKENPPAAELEQHTANAPDVYALVVPTARNQFRRGIELRARKRK